MNRRYKYIFNNYQFYENDALMKFLDRQAEKGFRLCGISGRFAGILKFQNTGRPAGLSHTVYCRHLDRQIDDEIESSQNGPGQKLCENIQFTVFCMPSSKSGPQKTPAMEKQDGLMSVSLKKSFGLIFALLALFVLSFTLKLYYPAGTSQFLSVASKCLVCTAPAFLFFLYLAGDLYDLKNGCAKITHGNLYFTDRTQFKNAIFYFAGLCSIILVAGYIAGSVIILSHSKDPVVLISLVQIWFSGLIPAYFFRLKYRRSYIFLLYVSVSLAIFGI